jgi:hypothetical protein
MSGEFCETCGVYFHSACECAANDHKDSNNPVTRQFGNVLHWIANLAGSVAYMEASDSSLESEANSMLKDIAAARDELEFLRALIRREAKS